MLQICLIDIEAFIINSIVLCHFGELFGTVYKCGLYKKKYKWASKQNGTAYKIEN